MNRRGFTLVEVIVTLTLASAIALIAHRGLGTLIAFTDRAAWQREETLRAAAVRRQLSAWIRAAHVGRGGDEHVFEGVDRTYGGRPDDRLRFVTATADPFEAGPARVALAIERGQSGDDLVASLSEITTNSDGSARDRTRVRPPADRRRRLVLIENVAGLDIRYRLRTGENIRWFDGWTSSVRLPTAVSIRISGDSVPPLLAVPLLVPLAGAQ